MAGQGISNPREAANELAQLFDSHDRVVFFGGAGVSTASGILIFGASMACTISISTIRPR